MRALSDSLTLPCGAVLPNRIGKAGMSEQLASRDGRVSDKLLRLYGVWARSGAGLLITGNAMIDRNALVEPRNAIVDDDRDADGLRRWADAAHARDAALWLQINHPGRVASVPFNRRPVAPSAAREPVPGFNLRTPRELTADDIERLVGAYAATAGRAVAAGFDGVQIHAAHGYLLAQFLSPLANRRTDRYGADAAGRRRMLLEVVAATRQAVGPRVPISVKLNSKDFQHGGLSEDESLEVAVALAGAGIDLLEISGGNYAEPAMEGVHHNGSGREGYFVDYAARVRERVDTPLMLTGGLRTRATMDALLGEGVIDVVGLARPMAFVPDYPARLLAGEPEPVLPRGLRDTGYRPIDGYLQLAIHNHQFHRIATGRTPQARPGVGTLLRALARTNSAGLKQAVASR